MKRIFYRQDIVVDSEDSNTLLLLKDTNCKYLVDDWSLEGFQSGVLCDKLAVDFSNDLVFKRDGEAIFELEHRIDGEPFHIGEFSTDPREVFDEESLNYFDSLFEGQSMPTDFLTAVERENLLRYCMFANGQFNVRVITGRKCRLLKDNEIAALL
ncbi:MAG TPA: hypothetical protein P5539_12375 [Mesotoga sp.]|nr:hypothetical protein [Mesotoga sp.]